MWKILTNIKI
jgi:hypothetical protein